MVITSFDFDPELQEELKAIIAEDSLEYPSQTNFINKAVRDKIKAIRGGQNGSDSNTTQ